MRRPGHTETSDRLTPAVPASGQRRGPDAAAVASLSKRRREVLELLAKGLTNAEVGRALGITEGTVRTHVTAVLGHLDVANRTEAASVWARFEGHLARVEEVLSRPAIAVLPLVPASRQPRASAIAARLTSDLCDLFARWCWFPVIARSSTRARRPNETDAELASQLGARFLVGGELDLDHGRFHLSLRVDDLHKQHCVWTERRDFPEDGLLQARDELCAELVAAAYPVLVARIHLEISASARQESLEAWGLAHDGMVLHGARDPVSNERARERFTLALARDPSLVLAHFGQGLVAYDAVLNQWGPKARAMDALVTAAQRCLDLAPHAAEGHYLLGRFFVARGEQRHAVPSLETAIARNPSFAQAHALLAQVLQVAGRSDEALARMRHAVRLGPRSFVAGLGLLHFTRGEYEQALEASELAVATNPRYPFARIMAAASAWWLEEPGKAAAHLDALREDSPDFSPSQFLATFGSRFDAVERIARALEAVDSKRHALPAHRPA